MNERNEREAAYEITASQPGWAGATAHCVNCGSLLGELYAEELGGHLLTLAYGYVPIGKRGGLPAYGSRNRNHQNRGGGPLRRGSVIEAPGGKRIRLRAARSELFSNTETAVVYCLNCGSRQRVGWPPIPIEPDPFRLDLEELRMVLDEEVWMVSE